MRGTRSAEARKLEASSLCSQLRVRADRELEGEHRAPARSVAMYRERAAQLPGRIGPAVQAETVAVFFRSEAMIEDSNQVLLRNPDPVIQDRYFDSSLFTGHPHGHALVRLAGLVASAFGVAHQVYEDLQGFMFLNVDLRHLRLIVAKQLNLMPRQ